MGMRKDAEAGAPASSRSRQRTGDPSMARSHPVLRLVVSNKYLDVASPTRMPRAATSRYLVLV